MLGRANQKLAHAADQVHLSSRHAVEIKQKPLS
jgi:hypothetical protein